jgi:hypothetical protein
MRDRDAEYPLGSGTIREIVAFRSRWKELVKSPGQDQLKHIER